MDISLKLDRTWKLPEDKNFLPELWKNHPFGRICCKARNITPTICDWTCYWCRKKMEEFRQNEPLRLKANDIILQWGDNDAEIELPDLSVYKENLEKRINWWQIKKQIAVSELQKEYSLYQRVEQIMSNLKKQVLSPESTNTLQ